MTKPTPAPTESPATAGDIHALLHTVWFTPGLKGRWGLPMLFSGEPGVAKSGIIEEAAIADGLACEVVIGSTREPTDFLGLPIPHGDSLAYLPPSWAQRLARAGHGVGFLDELSTATPAVQAALLRVILDGAVGDLVLPPTVRLVGAMNPVDIAAGGWDLAIPLANRFGHLPWGPPSIEAWSTWLLGAGTATPEAPQPHRAAEEEERVLALWPERWARASGIVTGFLRSAGGARLHRMPNAVDPAASKAWPSPRTWEMATRALAATLDTSGSDHVAGSNAIHPLGEGDRDLLVSSFVGAPAYLELATWLAQADLPDPAAVLDGDVGFTHDARRIDRTYATINACAGILRDPKGPRRKARAIRLWALFRDLMADAADLVVPGARVLLSLALHTDPDISAAQEPVMTRLYPYIQATGLAKGTKEAA